MAKKKKTTARNTYVVKGARSKRDFHMFSMAATLHLRGSTSIVWSLAIVVSAMLIAIFTDIVYNNGWIPDDVIGSTFMMVTAALVILFVVFWRFGKSVRHDWVHPEGNFCAEKTWTLTKQGVTEESPLTKSFADWRMVRDVTQDKNGIFIYIDNLQAYYIPHHFFSSAKKAEAFFDRAHSLWIEAASKAQKG